MRTIIAGSRDITDPQVIVDAVNACGWVPTVVISGAARGVDTLGQQWATSQSIPVERFPADWQKYGKAAGMIRNGQMAAVAEALIAIPSLRSKGTRDMISKAKTAGLRVYVREYCK